mmetsp:Transcript_35244/g.112694  ORF Transcript_35244/g.112694 Transcript_35244/m.112694 type:complete len:200 (+) Transcript_35244:168-767(+)
MAFLVGRDRGAAEEDEGEADGEDGAGDEEFEAAPASRGAGSWLWEESAGVVEGEEGPARAEAAGDGADDEHEAHPVSLGRGAEDLGEHREGHVPAEGKGAGDQHEANEEARRRQRRADRLVYERERPDEAQDERQVEKCGIGAALGELGHEEGRREAQDADAGEEVVDLPLRPVVPRLHEGRRDRLLDRKRVKVAEEAQ